jgi:acid phosphatase family membrane protein YuiD
VDIVHDLLLNIYFLSFTIAWIVSIIAKSTILSIQRHRRFSIRYGFENGGIPSSHTTAVSAITMAVLLRTGFTEAFFICLVFSAVVISDALRLRYIVGIQGEKLNRLLEKSGEAPIDVVYGHKFKQVIAGMIIGIVTATIIFWILF